MQRQILYWLALKLAGLMVLWMLFFSPSHRPHVDAGSTSRHLSLTEASTVQKDKEK